MIGQMASLPLFAVMDDAEVETPLQVPASTVKHLRDGTAVSLTAGAAGAKTRPTTKIAPNPRTLITVSAFCVHLPLLTPSTFVIVSSAMAPTA